MHDVLTMAVKETEGNKRYLFECRDADSPTGHSLDIKVESTHAGIVNGNARFYRPDRMQAGTHTWIPAPGLARRPVLVHHDKESDAIGRVHGAKYVDLSYQYQDPEVRKLIFYDGIKGTKKRGLYDSVDWVVDKLLSKPNYKGLGQIDLGLNILDPDAIQKIQDGRYITVSVSFSTDSAICSICHMDWAVDEPCDHDLGKMVDGRRMFLISGNMKYKECSFVNFPADPWGQIKTGSDALRLCADSLESRLFFMGLDLTERELRKTSLNLNDAVFSDSLKLQADIGRDEDVQMDLEAILQEIALDKLTKERALELRSQLQAAEDQATVKAALATLNAKIRVLGWSDDVPSKDLVQSKIDSLSAVLPTLAEDARATYLSQLAEQAKAAGIEFVPPGAAAEKPAVEAAAADAVVDPPAKTDAVKISDNPAIKLLTDHWVDGPSDDGKKTFPNSGKMLQHIDDTHMVHEGLTEHERPHFREALYCLQSLWSQTGSLNHVKEYIASRGDAMLPQKDLDQLHDAIASYEKGLKDKQTEIELLTQAQKAVLADSKKTMARLVVLGNVLLKEKGFEGLDAAQIQNEIDARSKRSMDSLKDSLEDLEKKLPLQATDTQKQDDVPVRPVDDKAQVPATAVTNDSTPLTESEDQTVDPSLLRMLSPRERQRLALKQRNRLLNKSLADKQ